MYLFGAPPAWWRYKWFHSQSTMAVNCTGSSCSNMEMEGKLHFAIDIVFTTFLTLYLFVRSSLLHRLLQIWNKIRNVNLVDLSVKSKPQKLYYRFFYYYYLEYIKVITRKGPTVVFLKNHINNKQKHAGTLISK